MPTRSPSHERQLRQGIKRHAIQRQTSCERGYDRHWQDARLQYLSEHPLCVACESEGRIRPANEVDHIIPHKSDMNLFWDKNNWQALCGWHHKSKTAKERRKPEYVSKNKITIVYGPPGSGKTTYCKQRLKYGDLFIDIDAIARALTGTDNTRIYCKSDNIMPYVFVAHNAVIDRLVRDGLDNGRTWIIGGYPQKRIREQLRDKLGAELVLLEVSEDECIKRIKEDDTRDHGKDKEWIKYVRRWWREYEP